MINRDAAAARVDLIMALTHHAQTAVTAIEHGDTKGGLRRYIATLADYLAAEIGPEEAAYALSEILMDAVDRWDAPLAALDQIVAKGGGRG